MTDSIAPSVRPVVATTRRRGSSLLARLLASLRLWVIIALLGGLLIPNLFVWQWGDAGGERRTFHELRLDLEQMADILVAAMREPLRQGSPERGRPILQAMFRDQRLVSVSIFEAGANKPFLEIFRSVSATAPLLTATRTINHEGRELGSLSVTLSAGPALERNRQDVEAAIVRLAISALISVVLVLLVFHFRLLAPVMRLQSDLRRLARGETMQREANWTGTEELRPLAEGVAKARRTQAAMRLRSRREPQSKWPHSGSR